MISRQLEVEARFTARRETDLDRLPGVLRALCEAVGSPRIRRVRDLYLDTADLWFLRAGVACRLRVGDHGAELGLKTLTPPRGGMASRVELVETLDRAPGAFPGPLPGRRLARWLEPLRGRAPVRPLFELAQQRTVYDVRYDGARFQVSADRLRLPGAAADRGDVEVELVEGDPDALRRFARGLRRALRLRTAAESKFSAGLAAAGIVRPVLDEGEDLVPRAEDRLVDAAYRVLGRQLRRLLWNEPGAKLGLDPEAVHDMRVATRRMRAALRIFRAALPERHAAMLGRDLKWLAAALGRVRDLDVHLERLQEDTRELPGELHAVLDDYRKCVRAERERAWRTAIRALQSRRFRRFVNHFERFFEAGPPARCRRAAARRPVAAELPEQVRTALGKVLKAGRRIEARSPDTELHALRIRCKRLRYLCEFFAAVLGRPSRKFTRRLVKLQGVLGLHQDAAVAQEMFRSFAAGRWTAKPWSEKQLFALGHLAAWELRNARDHRSAFFKAWAKFDRRKVRQPFREGLEALRRRAARPRAASRPGRRPPAASSGRPCPPT